MGPGSGLSAAKASGRWQSQSARLKSCPYAEPPTKQDRAGGVVQGHGFSRAVWQGGEAALAAEGWMAIPKRHVGPPGTHFITSRTWQSRRVFQQPEACRAFVDALARYRKEGKYLLHGFVLMPDHFHALLTPSGMLSLERAVQFIKGGSSRVIGESCGRSLPVWQRGFTDHRVRDAADYEEHLRYIHMNPVRAGLASDASKHAWSSASGLWKLDECPQRLKPLEEA